MLAPNRSLRLLYAPPPQLPSILCVVRTYPIHLHVVGNPMLDIALLALGLALFAAMAAYAYACDRV